MRNDERPTLPAFNTLWLAEFERAAGLQKLSPVWAKLEIVLGLTAVVLGLKLLHTEAFGWAGGALSVLGGYLALAGNRSHLYQSMNRQNAYLLQTLHLARAWNHHPPDE